MNLRRSRSEDPEVNLTPLIDVVFILLIFFMVSTTFQKESRIRIELPQASGEPAEAQKKLLEIVIDTEGHFFIGGQQVVNSKVDTLKQAIQKYLGEQTDLPVMIRADRMTPYQSVVTAMDATAQLGLTQMSLATAKPPGAED